MNKLWVDDIRPAPDASWAVARTVGEAIRMIARMRFDEISLDHDDGYETFEAVAYFIGEKYFTDKGFPDADSNMRLACPRIHPKMTIHSANPVGARHMMDVLKDYGITSVYIPA